MKIKIYSFFSGGGFLDLGFENEEYEIVFVNECNKEFLKAYKYARKKMNYAEPIHGYFENDIKLLLENSNLSNSIEKDAKNAIIGFIGGPPCPDFSVAGKNRGIEGENGELTNVYKEIILKYKPDFFLFENVKGLWKTKKHKIIFEKIKKEFLLNGYVLSEKLVNALEYGVPQDRERILLFGFKYELVSSDKMESQKKLDNEFNWGNSLYDIKEIKNIKWPKKEKFICDEDKKKPKDIIEELSVEYWFKKNKVTDHINSEDFFTPRAVERFFQIEEGDVSRKSFKRLHRWRYSPTVAYGNNEVHLHPYKPRRLTVSEALSLQSLPINYIIMPSLSLSNKFKMIGNGVPYLMSKAISHNINVFLKRNIIV